MHGRRSFSGAVALASACASLSLLGSAYAGPDEEGGAAAEAVDGGSVDAEVSDRADRSRRFLGAMLDAGVPDGANLALVWRPFHWLRLHAGPSYNLNSFGVRGGVSLLPVDSWITPSLVLEGGHFFDGDLGATMESVLGVDAEDAPERLSYTYSNAHLGLELGSSDFRFFIRGGYSYVSAELTPADPAEGDNFRFDDDVYVTAWSPSAKLGFVVYFL